MTSQELWLYCCVEIRLVVAILPFLLDLFALFLHVLRGSSIGTRVAKDCVDAGEVSQKVVTEIGRCQTATKHNKAWTYRYVYFLLCMAVLLSFQFISLQNIVALFILQAFTSQQ